MRKFLVLLCLPTVGLAGCGSDGGDVDVANKTRSESEFTGKGGKDFCEYYKEQTEKFESIGEEMSPAEQKKNAAQVLEAVDEIAERAPDEIKEDVALSFGQARPRLEAMAKGEEYTPKAEDQPTEDESKAVEAASLRVQAYATDVCGVKDETQGDPVEEAAMEDCKLLSVAEVAAATGYEITTMQADRFNIGCQYVTEATPEGESGLNLRVGDPEEPKFEATEISGFGDKAVFYTATAPADEDSTAGTATMHITVGDRELRLEVFSPEDAETKEARVKTLKRVATAAIAAYKKAPK